MHDAGETHELAIVSEPEVVDEHLEGATTLTVFVVGARRVEGPCVRGRQRARTSPAGTYRISAWHRCTPNQPDGDAGRSWDGLVTHFMVFSMLNVPGADLR